jgi:ribose transport system ATP-binding protein
MRAVSKRFHGVVALDSVDFAVRAGEVHALVGENGAGKSTLIKLLTGVYRPDAGDILLGGKRVAFATPHAAQAAGIATIYQEVNLVPTLSAAENIFLGREPRTRWRIVNWARMRRDAEAHLQRYGIAADVTVPIAELGLATQQMIAIARALSLGGSVIVMDEPTSALTHREVDQLMGMTDRIRGEGVSVIYISHRLDELFRIADRITVLRDGRRVLTAAMSEISRGELVTAMLGRELAHVEQRGRQPPLAGDKPALTVTALSRAPRVRAATLTIRPGEIVGLAGLQGSGRTELMRLIFGADECDGGTVQVGGAARPARSPAQALAAGIAYLPEDRKADGIIPDLSLRENMTLVVLPMLTRLGIVARGREQAIVERFIARLGIRAASPDIRIRDLSGGNQQKVLIARLLCSDPSFLMLDDPMRGIDVGAKAEILRLIFELADGGQGVLVASSELHEVLALADRVAVVRDGQIVGELARGEASFDTVATMIAAEHTP